MLSAKESSAMQAAQAKAQRQEAAAESSNNAVTAQSSAAKLEISKEAYELLSGFSQ